MAVRKLDPAGLGVWYLARIRGTPNLTDLCRRAVAAPGTGPPRPIARMIDRALAGESVCWFGESGGFEALCAETMITTALASTLTASKLLWANDGMPWKGTLAHFTRAANATQATVRAHRRVMGQLVETAEGAARLAYRAVNVVRRALNHTDLLAIDDQLAREAARLALDSASAACTAAIEWGRIPPGSAGPPEANDASEKLAALARSVDALVARIVTAMRSESVAGSPPTFVLEQSARVLHNAPKAVRAWSIVLQVSISNAGRLDADDLCRRSNELAEASTEILESWATLHELLTRQTSQTASIRPTPTHGTQPHGIQPLWVNRLVRTASGEWSVEDVIGSISDLARSPDRAIAGAVCLAALQSSSLPLRRDLWTFIRDLYPSELEKSLAFQLFCRLEPR